MDILPPYRCCLFDSVCANRSVGLYHRPKNRRPAMNIPFSVAVVFHVATCLDAYRTAQRQAASVAALTASLKGTVVMLK